MNPESPKPGPVIPEVLDIWHLPINQAGWHLALTDSGLFRVRSSDPVPEGAVRLYPGMLHAWRWFERDGELRPEFEGRPMWGNK